MTEKTLKDFKTAESLLTFPCEFPIKIMGKANPELKNEVLKIFAQHQPEFKPEDLTINESKGGNYHALTAVIHAKSKLQLDAIYQALTDHELVIMAL